MRDKIESPANGRLRLAANLQRTARRHREGLFVCEGVRLCEMAADSDWELEYAVYTAELGHEERGARLLDALEQRGCALYETEPRLYKKASATQSPQGILVVARQRSYDWRQVAAQLPPDALVVVLDGVQDPGNVGTIIRTADAAGAAAVLVRRGSADVYGDKVVRSTMGSLFHLPVISGLEPEDIKAFAAAASMDIYATALTPDAHTIYETDMTGGLMLVFGSEANGVTPELLQMSEALYIPMYGQAESLNVAGAAAITLYEAVRQRHVQPAGHQQR